MELDNILILTYRNEQVFSNYFDKDSINNTMSLNDTLITVIGYRAWSSPDYIAVFSGFNRLKYFNGVKIGKNQIVQAQTIATDLDGVAYVNDITELVKSPGY